MQAAYQEFRSRGVELWAIAFHDTLRALSISQLVQAEYPFLADADHAVADAYGVFNLLNDGVATPSVFVIDPAGRIVWSYVGRDASDRPSADDILSHVPRAGG